MADGIKDDVKKEKAAASVIAGEKTSQTWTIVGAVVAIVIIVYLLYATGVLKFA